MSKMVIRAAVVLLMASGAKADFHVDVERIFLGGNGFGEYEWVEGFTPYSSPNETFFQSPGWSGGWNQTWLGFNDGYVGGVGASSGGLIEEAMVDGIPSEGREVAFGGTQPVGDVCLIGPDNSASGYFELCCELSGMMFSQVLDDSIVTAHTVTITGISSIDYRVSDSHVIEFEGSWDDVFSLAIVLPTGPRELNPRSGMRLPHGDYRIGGNTQVEWIWPVGWPDSGAGFLSDDVDLAKFRIRFREVCLADLDDDGMVGGADLGFLLSAWGTPSGDLDGDGVTDGADLGTLLGAWGVCIQ